MEKVQAAQKASHFEREREELRERPQAMPASGPRSGGAVCGREEVEKDRESCWGRRRRRVVVATALFVVVVVIASTVVPRRRAAWDSAAATNERDWFICFVGTTTMRDAEKDKLDDEHARREAAAAAAEAIAIDEAFNDVADESIDEPFASA